MNSIDGSVPGALKIYLKQVTMMMHQAHVGSHGYNSLEDFVLKRGVGMPNVAKELPKGLRRGKMGHCYENSANIATGKPRFTYCEGYASSCFPMMHAWLVDIEGRVIDPTWEYRPEVEYYGIPIRHDYLVRSLIKAERYGLIDRYDLDWPMLTDAPEDYLAPIMGLLQKQAEGTPLGAMEVYGQKLVS